MTRGDGTRGPVALPPHRRPTIKDVAQAAGVSRSAASRALRNDGYVGERSRRRVLEAAADLGYVPHVTARYLKEGVSRCVGVLVADLRDPDGAALAAGVARSARDAGLATMVADLAGRPGDALTCLTDFVAFGVAGAVLGPVSDEPATYLGRYGIPVVEVGERLATVPCDAVVGGEPYDAGREAVRCLLERFAEPDRPAAVVTLPPGGHGDDGSGARASGF
ncbi:LacI family DNA-binding transcriptional regulator [Cellulomonas carbonis]|uniref:LacI family DNA-binding transcriptional regulator n=1 Tax=Cellulomonas carbonis TaxID=1386092 RepID=UPI0009DE9055|nr:LacI family DNA-binding transcriptional regulator [Cellulomonas carbonis]GGC17383.1 hypothetical protein GCM10010972_33300 [Cellulomonas carbonis]